jgi:molybdopterin molybdotransferase
MTLADLPGCGCDVDPAPGLVSLDAAVARGLALARTVTETERLPLPAAIGRVLAGPVRSPLPLPPFDNAAMDGYALATAELIGDGPWLVPVAGRIAAGSTGAAPRPSGSALRILTGAPVPSGCDTVVMQEHVLRRGDAIRLDRRPSPGLNIRRRGEDLPFGAPVLPGGQRIGAREAAALAATGAETVAVRRHVRVAFFCSGSELVAPGQRLGPGQIYNANRFALLGALAEPWIEARDLGAVPDDPGALAAALTEAAAFADLVVSTGGVSAGDEDHLPAVVASLGGRLDVLRIAMKPGKPLKLGRLGDAIYLGLPGNPVAAQVGWTLLGRPIAERLAGVAAGPRTRTVVKAGFALSRRPGRCEIRPARVVGYDSAGASIVTIVPGAFSARVAELAAADGLVLIPAEETQVREGHLLEFMAF